MGVSPSTPNHKGLGIWVRCWPTFEFFMPNKAHWEGLEAYVP